MGGVACGRRGAQLTTAWMTENGVPVERTNVAELSAMGVAHLAGVSAGLFTFEELGRMDRGAQGFEPHLPAAARAVQRRAWTMAVARARGQAIN